MIRTRHDAYPGAETNPGLVAEPAVKRNLGVVLDRLRDEVAASNDAGDYLRIHMLSSDGETGLSKAFSLDR